VAQEVKSLAEQSKQATTQVRTILNEIQKATGAAVMATEQGSKAVEAGLEQAEEAGHSIQELSSSIGDAAQAAVQIAASSQEQLIGVDQVALAMNSVKDASTQNVTSMKQLEAAARDLSQVGQNLTQLVTKFSNETESAIVA
jgi:methyl-accepting chemotaxis protein